MTPKLGIPELQDFLAAEFPQVADDFVVRNVGAMTLDLTMAPQERHLRPGGTVSGPSLFALADCGVYLCLIAMVGPEALAVTTNASIDFMRKPEAGQTLLANVRLLKLGRSLVVGDVQIRPETGVDLVARATLTYSRPRSA
ncbi:MAG: PaaI family thioesterase [Silicimonas sp.]|nr:PaaI family thioesterase [Silicimonas sp.]